MQKVNLKPVLIMVLVALLALFIFANDLRMKIRLYVAAYRTGFSINEIQFTPNEHVSKNVDVDIYSDDFCLLTKEEREDFYSDFNSEIGKHWYRISFHSGGVVYDGYYFGLTVEEYKEERNAKEKEKETERKEKEAVLKAEYSNTDMPYVGMDEEGLPFTKIGPPDSINECVDFKRLDKAHKAKTYKWSNTSNGIESVVVTVCYRKYHSRNADDYEDLPDDNGYVESVWTDHDGKINRETYHDKFIY